ncbi:hypothetical protein CLV59_105375 [Chitinophaga dinghuensis]|uniref:Uncharacterized protein n=1 Tax=Chitinophaga dinghuensis TaxID=1539050 RepID=A0A327VW95_9BACT|nr:hypothetical protein [Chitinophaga dinghuensis]RAJ80267.1 hypothetical protein CLV59_105375 [Chitinophaga dinghuensis]
MFKIGSIVGLKSHPLRLDFSQENLVIGGDAQSIPPLMVVVETLLEFEVLENSSEVKQCRCSWYSHKTHTFESEWFLVHLLFELPSKEKEVNDPEISPEIGTMVRFKTTGIELGKKKSSIDFSGSSNSSNRSISSLLYFVAPVLQVIAIIESNNKQLTNEKPRKKWREESKIQLKCKYFDINSNKFCEIILPLESIEIIQSVDESKIDCINGAILGNKCLRLTSMTPDVPEVLIKPNIINYRSGLYYIEGFNFLTGKSAEYLLNGNNDTFKEQEFSLAKLPKFIPLSNGLFNVIKISKQSILELNPNFYWRIKYQDNNGSITDWTIHSPEVIEVIEEKINSDNSIPQIYVKAFCMLRNAHRHFKVDGIKEIVQLNILLDPTKGADILVDQKGQIAQEAQDVSLS